jgi:hypothetical protein
MPAKGKTKVSEPQRKAIIEAKLAGGTNYDAARAAGTCYHTASIVWKAADTQAIVARARLACAPIISQVIEKIYQTLLEDLESARTLAERQKLRAEGFDLAARGDVSAQPAGAEAADGTQTLQELLLTVRKAVIPAGTTIQQAGTHAIHPPISND